MQALVGLRRHGQGVPCRRVRRLRQGDESDGLTRQAPDGSSRESRSAAGDAQALAAEATRSERVNKLGIPFVVLSTVVILALPLFGRQASVSEPAAYRPNEISISLQRTACLGFCPVYVVTIFGDGTVKYFGSQHVGVEGSQQDRVSPDQVERLLNAFLEARIFDTADTYDEKEVVTFQDGQFVRLLIPA